MPANEGDPMNNDLEVEEAVRTLLVLDMSIEAESKAVQRAVDRFEADIAISHHPVRSTRKETRGRRTSNVRAALIAAACCLVAMSITAAITIADNDSASSPRRDRNVFAGFSSLRGAATNTNESAVQAIVDMADSGERRNGVPVGNELNTEQAVTVEPTPESSVTMVPGADGKSLCWQTVLAPAFGSVKDGTCVAYLPESGILMGGSNDTRVNGYVVYGLATDDAGRLTITTRAGERKPVSVKDNFFIWTSTDRLDGAPVTFEARNNRGEIRYSQDLTALTDAVAPPMPQR